MAFLMDILSPKIKKIGFEDVQYAIGHTSHFLIINTLPVMSQDCLIKNTIHSQQEETVINDLISDYRMKARTVIVYGLNATDETCEPKYKQLVSLGFSEVYWYVGGLFEWAMLQDIYGEEEFPTSKKIVDILRYKPKKNI